VAQTITTMSAGSTCRLHASQTLKLLPYNSSHMVLGNPVNSLLKQAAIFSISNRIFYKQWILQCLQHFDIHMHSKQLCTSWRYSVSLQPISYIWFKCTYFGYEILILFLIN